MNTKKKVLFVGSFVKNSKDGGVGGQMFACNTIVNSPISEEVNWTLIDTTAENTSYLSSTYHRVQKALIRLCKFIYHLLTKRFDCVLIFTGDGWSFWEKGLMSLIAKYLTRSKVILAPRSGFIINDIEAQGLLSKFITFVFTKTDIIVCQSAYWKTLFSKSAPSENPHKFVIVENMVDFDKYKDLSVNSKEASEKVVVLYMAWVTRNKGIFELLEAVKLLKQHDLPFKVIVAGNGDSFEEVNNYIVTNRLADHIEMQGWVLGDKKYHYSRRRIFLSYLPTSMAIPILC